MWGHGYRALRQETLQAGVVSISALELFSYTRTGFPGSKPPSWCGREPLRDPRLAQGFPRGARLHQGFPWKSLGDVERAHASSGSQNYSMHRHTRSPQPQAYHSPTPSPEDPAPSPFPLPTRRERGRKKQGGRGNKRNSERTRSTHRSRACLAPTSHLSSDTFELWPNAKPKFFLCRLQACETPSKLCARPS